MIRFKDQIFEEYSIDPVTAVITDQNGVVQKTYMHNGRPVFKGMGIHCIMVHTFNSYKPGMDIHHLDENKLNNSLSNLVYLSRSEHNSLHKKCTHHSDETKSKISATMKGKPKSDATRAKISTAQKGKPHPHKGKKLGPLSAEHRAKISASMTGKKRGPYKKKARVLNGSRAENRLFHEIVEFITADLSHTSLSHF